MEELFEKVVGASQLMFFGFQRGFWWHAAVSSSSEAKDLGGEKAYAYTRFFF